MAFAPISLITIQYQNPADNTPYSGAVLKAYAAGTSTNIPMATNVTGATTFTSVALNSSGNPEHLGATIIPHVDQAYKIALYATQAAADADTPAVWSIDNLTPITITGLFTLDDAVSNAVSNVVTISHTTTGTPVAGIGTGQAFRAETAIDNIETGMIIEAVATDVTAGSEDFDFVVKLMAAGAAPVVAMRVTSAGVLTASGTTIGNLSSGGALGTPSSATLTNATGLPAVGVVGTAAILGANTFAGIQRWAKGADVASATALPVLTDGNYFDVTGGVTVTSIDTVGVGTTVGLHFDDALILTHNATSLVLPGGANITTAANDEAEFIEYSTGNWRCTSYSRADGTALFLSSTVVQVVNTQTGAVATGTTTIPNDDTIPQNNEGDQYMSLSITPTSATNMLKIDVVIFAANSSVSSIPLQTALFQDSTANALSAVSSIVVNAGTVVNSTLTHYMTAGTTSSTTFKVRIGGSAAGTTTFNGSAGARKYGGVAGSSITISEINP